MSLSNEAGGAKARPAFSSAPLDPLRLRRLSGTSARDWRIVCLERAGSTNDVAGAAAERGTPEKVVFFAEEQSAGRGRERRRWSAPRGLAVLATALLRPPRIDATLGEMAALAALRAVRSVGVDASIKWPNDVLVGKGKVGGVLIETAAVSGGPAYALVGVGLNANQSQIDLPATTYPVTSLALAAGHPIDRSIVAAALIAGLETEYQRILTAPSDTFAAWRRELSTIGREVRVTGAEGGLCGLAIDVEPSGELIVRLVGGRCERVRSGEVSLHEA